jgi:indolepyruvate ferredoxin oxidoreductase
MNAKHEGSGLRAVALDDKYTVTQGAAFMTGTQALVRLPMLQQARDAAAGLNTAGLITGYRGSPLGSYDQALERAQVHLDAHKIRFQPAVNEEIAATALWGTQQLNLIEPSRHDGVFGIWYGKGPGVDRCGDALRHANAAGTAPRGGVLALAGDDHGARSSTQSAQSDFIFQAVGIPIFAPSNVQELIDLGLHGFAASRYSGCWVALKCVTDVVESAAVVQLDPGRATPRLPGSPQPAGGLNIRWPEITGFVDQEKRLYHDKLSAVLDYAFENRLDQPLWRGDRTRLGIVATGKAWADLRQALDDLGIDERLAGELGIALYKVAMPWPLEPRGISRFCRGLEEVLVIEEKRPLVEPQLKDLLYHLPETDRPAIIGKFARPDADGSPSNRRLMPSGGELSPAHLAGVIAEVIRPWHASVQIERRLAALAREEALTTRGAGEIARLPWFCAGCPHNSSTRLPEGSRALAGIGCHYMVQWMDRDTATFSHMGCEGAAWLGQAPFSDTPHVFANIGDGTYFHSGILAIRAAAAVRLRITYKILFNDAVAMTGGQSVDGPLTVPQVTRQVAAEGVDRIAVVTDEPDKYPADADFAPGVTIHHRDDLDAVQRELREHPGTSVLVYDQTCAAEKRRRRKRGTFADPDRRVIINEAVCEGCGDCGEQSNCVAIEPVDTPLGRKRQINQSACNKDESCIKGFCPSFVTIEGARLRSPIARPGPTGKAGKGADAVGKPALESLLATLPAAPTAATARCSIIVTGIGGTGVVTVGQVIGMAAHLEGKSVTVLDVAGMSQKNGAVMSFVRIADDADSLHATRVATAGADTLIGCDAITTAGAECLSKIEPGRTRAVVNRSQTPTAAFTRERDWEFPQKQIEERLVDALGADHLWQVDAQRLATSLLGDAIGTNLFMLGYALQQGLVPLSPGAIEGAIRLNGVAISMNLDAFRWGRCAAHDPEAVNRIATPTQAIKVHLPKPDDLDAMIADRVARLAQGQGSRVVQRYLGLVETVRSAEARATGGTRITTAVARNFARLLATKDEYEVARLHASPEFRAWIDERFEPGYRLHFHLAPPLLNRPDPVSGIPKKSRFGPWMMAAFRILAAMRPLRGTWFDPFGHTAERRMELALAVDYESIIKGVLPHLNETTARQIADVATVPESIRGYGHVKARSVEAARVRWHGLLERIDAGAVAARSSGVSQMSSV